MNELPNPATSRTNPALNGFTMWRQPDGRRGVSDRTRREPSPWDNEIRCPYYGRQELPMAIVRDTGVGESSDRDVVSRCPKVDRELELVPGRWRE